MFTPRRQQNSRRTTALIWTFSISLYAIAFVIAYQCDFIRFSRYSVEELEARKQANEKKNAELRKNMHVEKKAPPEDELRKILDRRERREKDALHKQIEEIDDVIEHLEERTEELKQVYQARRIPEWEAYERILAIANGFSGNPQAAYLRSIRIMQTNARRLSAKLASVDPEEVPPIFTAELEALLQSARDFRGEDAHSLEAPDVIAPAVWRAMEMERLILHLLGRAPENAPSVYDLDIRNTPPDIPPQDAPLADLEKYLAAVQDQLETANAELNTYLNAIRNMQSVDSVMDAASAKRFSADIRQQLEHQGIGLREQVDRDMRRAEKALESMEDARENLEQTIGFYQELIDRNTFNSQLMRDSYRQSMQEYENKLKENRLSADFAKNAMIQAARAENTFSELMESQNFQPAAQYADFIRSAAQDIVNAAAQRDDDKPAPPRQLDRIRENSAVRSADAANLLNRQLERLANQNTGPYASPELDNAINTIREEANQALRDNRVAVQSGDALSAWEKEQQIEQLQSAAQSAARQQAMSSQQGQGQQGQGGQSGQSGQQGQGGRQGVSQQEFLDAMDHMESLSDQTESLRNRAGSIARGAGLDLPLSAQRLFTALQNQALRRAGQSGQQGQQGQQGQGQQGQGQSGQSGLPGMMETLGRMQRQGQLGGGQQGQGGQGQGRMGNGTGYQQGQGGQSGVGISRGTFDFQHSGHVSGRIGELIGASAGKTGADPGIIAESVPGRRFSANAQCRGIVFIDSWYVIGPWDSHGEDFSAHTPQEPETHIDLDANYLGKVDPATGKPIKLRWHYVQTDTICVRPPMKMEEAYYYAYTDVFFEEPTDAVALIGTDDAGKIWVNKQVVWEDDGLSTWALTEGILNVHFNRGWNSILIAVQNGPDECQFSFAIVGTATSE